VRRVRTLTEEEFDQRFQGLVTDVNGDRVEIAYADAPGIAHALTKRRLWTEIEGDEGGSYLIAGWAYVNRLGYYTTVTPWEADEAGRLMVRWATGDGEELG
jgi:hypothetical protein